MPLPSLPVAALSNSDSNLDADSGIISRMQCSCCTLKFPLNSWWSSLRNWFCVESQSIYKYQTWLWPKEKDFLNLKKVISGQPLWTASVELVLVPSRSTPRMSFKLDELHSVECDLVESSRSTTAAQECREINLALQMQRRRWLIMKKIAMDMDKKIRIKSSSDVIFEKMIMESTDSTDLEFNLTPEEWLFKDLDKEYKSVGCDAKKFKPGPVGEFPIHQCFLLDLKDIGKEIVKRYFSSPELISIPYKNDLDPWRTAKGTGESNGELREDGLYTGETILHIAIVKEDVDLVQTLLKKGASLSSRATGVFFQPSLVPLRVGELSARQRVMAWVGGVDLTLKESAAVKQEPNRYAGCYYGELPLSFAASVGNVEICRLLYEWKCKRASEPQCCFMPEDERQAEPVAQCPPREMLRKLNPHHAKQQPPGSVWDFVTAADSFCNTAMHMAVIHRRREVVDWLMSIEGGRECLETLNCAGFTPLTLAVHEGHVDMFNHILYTHMSSIVWRYGRVRRRQTDLLQVDTFRLFGGREGQPHRHLHTNRRWRSALEVIATHEVQAFARNDMFNRLIDDKWRQFGRRMYLLRTVLPYTLLLAVYASCVVLRADELHRDRPRDADGLGAGTAPRHFCVQEASGWAWAGSFGNASDGGSGDSDGGGGDSGLRMATLVLESVLVVVWSPFLVWKGWRQRRVLLRDLDTNEDGKLDLRELRAFVHKNLHFLLDFGAAGALFAAGVGRLRCDDRGELESLAVAGVLLFTNLLNVLMPFKFVGVLVISVYKMLVGDLFRFLLVFGAMLLGFACAMLLLVQRPGDPGDDSRGDDSRGAGVGDMLLHLLWVALGDGLADSSAGLESAPLYLALHITWVVLSSVLMLNLLIAMMGRTFDRDADDTHSIWIFPFASLVLRYERMLSRDERKAHRTGSSASGGGAGQAPRGSAASEGGVGVLPAGAGVSADAEGGVEAQRYVEVDIGEESPAEEGTALRLKRERAEALAAHRPLLDLAGELMDVRLAKLRNALRRRRPPLRTNGRRPSKEGRQGGKGPFAADGGDDGDGGGGGGDEMRKPMAPPPPPHGKRGAAAGGPASPARSSAAAAASGRGDTCVANGDAGSAGSGGGAVAAAGSRERLGLGGARGGRPGVLAPLPRPAQLAVLHSPAGPPVDSVQRP